jgi:CSLREA domain-containing protein
MGSSTAFAKGKACRVAFALFALFALTGARMVVGAAPAAAAGGTYVVTSTDDTGGGTLCQGSQPCTLRAAIQRANRDGGASRIEFNIPNPGPHTITIGSGAPLEGLFEGFPTTIDGYTQPGSSPNSHSEISNAVLMVQLDGDGPSSGQDADGFSIFSAGNVVAGLALYDMRKPINIFGANGNTVRGNFIGTNAAGTFATTVRDDAAAGVVMERGAKNNTIGGAAAADRNVISGNPARGVFVNESDTDANNVVNNIVGLSPDGSRALPNRAHGIDLNSGGANNLFRANVVSGNLGSGIEISHPYGDTRGNRVVDNVFGLLPGGRGFASHTRNGPGDPDKPNLRIEDGPVATEITGNVIGNSPFGGIRIDSCVVAACVQNPATTGTRVVGNLIGVTRSGAPASNGPYGVQIDSRATLTTLGPDNEIAHNDVGVKVLGEGTDANTITRNSIHDNGGLGIDLDAVANDQVNRPVISSTTSSSVSGTACGRCVVEVFVTDGGGDGAGEGRTYLASGTADDGGAFSVPIPSSSTARTVTATATDPAGNTSEFSSNVALATGPIAADAFERTVSGGWGTADAGGPWSTGGALESASFSVDGGAGSVTVPTAPMTREATLTETSELDVDVTATVWTNRRATAGDGLVVSLEARRQSDTLAYRARLRLAPDGSVHLGLEAGGALIGSEVTVPGVVHDPDTRLRLRFRARGASPTNLDAKVWLASQPEPGGWNLALQDSTASLQSAGSLGILVGSSETLLAPSVTFSFDDYSVQSPSGK